MATKPWKSCVCHSSLKYWNKENRSLQDDSLNNIQNDLSSQTTINSLFGQKIVTGENFHAKSTWVTGIYEKSCEVTMINR